MSTIKKIIKSLVGKDLWIRVDQRIPTEFHGTEYGGWAIAAKSLNENSVVYSFGVGEDASFDLSLITSYSCTVHAFDPTPKSIHWVSNTLTEEKFVFHPWALGERDGQLKLYLPTNSDHVSASVEKGPFSSDQYFNADCFRLGTIRKRLGHQRIDVLKMDIEGAEYGVIDELVKSREIDDVVQLLVEFHHVNPPFTKKSTIDAIISLRNEGFLVIWVSKVGHEVLFKRR